MTTTRATTLAQTAALTPWAKAQTSSAAVDAWKITQGRTPARHRRGRCLRKLPAGFIVPTGRLPLSEGRVTLNRRVSGAGAVPVLSQTFRVGERQRGLYRRRVVDTGRKHLTAYLNGRVLKRWP
jgi:hypothetical protein